MAFWKDSQPQRFVDIPPEVVSDIRRDYYSGRFSRRNLSFKYKVTINNLDRALYSLSNRNIKVFKTSCASRGKAKPVEVETKRTILTHELKLKIIRLYSSWKYSQRRLAVLLGVGRNVIANVWMNRWRILAKSGYRTLNELLAEGTDDLLSDDDGKEDEDVDSKGDEDVSENDRMSSLPETESKLIANGHGDDYEEKFTPLPNLQMTALLNDQLWLWLRILEQKHAIIGKEDVWAQAQLVAQAIGITLEKEPEQGWLERFTGRDRFKRKEMGLVAEYGPEDIYSVEEIGIRYQHQGDEREDDLADGLTVILCGNAAGEKESAVICGHSASSSFSCVPANVIYFCQSSYPDPEVLLKVYIRRLNDRMSKDGRHILLFLGGSRNRIIRFEEQFSNVKLLFFPLDRMKCFLKQPLDVGPISRFKLGYTRCLLRMFQQQLQWKAKPETLRDFLKLNVSLENAVYWIAEAWQNVSEKEIGVAFRKVLSVDTTQLKGLESMFSSSSEDLQEIRRFMNEFPSECCLRSVPEDSVACFFDVRVRLDESVPERVSPDFPELLFMEGEKIRDWGHFLGTLQELKKFTSDRGELALCCKLEDLETEIVYIMRKELEDDDDSSKKDFSLTEQQRRLKELLA